MNKEKLVKNIIEAYDSGEEKREKIFKLLDMYNSEKDYEKEQKLTNKKEINKK